ncbi:MAG: CDP-archaeol synthase [Clostridia bacterium]|nr:CDP-archaeol synthase [Clostridia bacterium]
MIVTIPVLFLTDTLVLTAYMMAVACIGIFELLRCIKLNKWYIVIPTEIAAVASHVICRLSLFGGENLTSKTLMFIYLCIVAVFVFYLFALSIFLPEKYNIETNGFGGLMCTYIVAATVSAVMLCEIPNGKYAFPLLFVASWMADAFAYLIGMKLGKHKLCPKISPKKSVEGAIGGIVGCIIGTLVYAFIVSQINRDLKPSYVALVITAIVLAVISQLGDLVMSLVKRRFGIKDYGKLLPGHGGILDRFDSVIAVSIFIFVIYTLFEPARGFI